MTQRDFPDIAVLGAGIGGLATAAFLHRAGLSATVYEQATALKEVGAGLIVAPNMARLLRRIGVLEALERTAVRLDVGWEFRRWQDGTVLSAEDLREACERLYGEHTYAAHRADLLDVLASAVPPASVRLSRRCTSVGIRDGRPELRFEDGEVVHPDVLIGADGIHSIVRQTFAEPGPATYSGMCVFRATVPIDRAPEFARRPAQTLWLGPDHHFVHYPISRGSAINIFAAAPARGMTIESWTATATTEEFQAEFAGWDERVDALIRGAGTPGRWALLDRAPLERWTYGPVTLLGDAAHPMYPFFGQGAAQSIEDAAALALALAEEPENPQRALDRYETVRRPHSTRLQQVSHARRNVNHLPDGAEQLARDRAFREADPLVANGWIYGYDPEEAIRRV